jgi:hypothetical protein
VSTLCARDERTAPLNSLKEFGTNRLRGIDPTHVELLAEVPEEWPPILVWRWDNQIVDGYHRVAAAKLLNMVSIPVEWFEGTAEEAYIESVRRNTRGGLPLTLRQRVKASETMLEKQPDWSDRRIALLCGLSATTVARARSESRAATTGSRVGRDGRVRPSHPGDARRRVLSALEKDPHGSLRSIASLAAVSPETVRTIKRRLQDEKQLGLREPRAALKSVSDEFPLTGLPVMREPGTGADAKTWESDVALASCESAESLLEWLSGGSGIYDWPTFVKKVPLSRIYEIADESRRRANAWERFAGALEARSSGRSAVAS